MKPLPSTSDKKVPTHGTGTSAFYKGDPCKILLVRNGRTLILVDGKRKWVNHNSITDQMFGSEKDPLKMVIQEAYNPDDSATDVIISELQKALAEEMITAYQYWYAAQVIFGPERKAIQATFSKHVFEELEHAQKLSDRIIQLGATPPADPRYFFSASPDAYIQMDALTTSAQLVEVMKQSEQNAINRYNGIVKMTTNGVDPVTEQLAKEILAKETEHDQDMIDYINDINTK